MERDNEPVSEEHSSTETTKTEKKRPFLRYETSRRKLTSTFPRHLFTYLINKNRFNSVQFQFQFKMQKNWA